MPVYKIQRSRRGDTRAVAVYDGGTRPTKEEEVRRYLEEKAELREGSHVLRSMKNLEVDPPTGPRSPVLHGQEAAEEGFQALHPEPPTTVTVEVPAQEDDKAIEQLVSTLHPCTVPGCTFKAATTQGLKAHMRAKHKE